MAQNKPGALKQSPSMAGLTRVSPGVYRNAQGQLVGNKGQSLQPNRPQPTGNAVGSGMAKPSGAVPFAGTRSEGFLSANGRINGSASGSATGAMPGGSPIMAPPIQRLRPMPGAIPGQVSTPNPTEVQLPKVPMNLNQGNDPVRRLPAPLPPQLRQGTPQTITQAPTQQTSYGGASGQVQAEQPIGMPAPPWTQGQASGSVNAPINGAIQGQANGAVMGPMQPQQPGNIYTPQVQPIDTRYLQEMGLNATNFLNRR